MKFLHLADLHFGKTIHGVSLLENGDQGAWVDRFLALTDEVHPDAVVIAGDVYDRSAPSGDAVALLSRMLTALAERHIPVLLTAGNHDSVQRLSFAAPLLDREGVHISEPLAPGRALSHVTLTDEHGPVTFWLMPYVFPALIARALGEDTPRDYDSAVRALLAAQNVDFTQRNVIVAHQNVTANGAEGLRGGSETMVGGVGQIDYTAFDGFDYAALGHIHAAYHVGRESVRYAGSPMCYHFDETRQSKKGPVLVTLNAPGEPALVETLTIEALHPMRELRGDYETLRQTLSEDRRAGEYLRIVLTDQRVTPESSQYFRGLCERRGSVLMELCSEYQAFAAAPGDDLTARALEERSAEDLFCDFFTQRAGGEPPSEADAALLSRAGELLRGAVGRDPEERDVQALLDFVLHQEVDA